jgi:hemolysin activation/secretion protein
VRGFSEREVAADQGLRLSLELWAPAIDWEPWRFIPLGFADVGMVKRNQPLASEIAEQTISSVGVGLRGSYGRRVSARVDWGYVTQGQTTPTGSNKLQTTVVVSF